MSAISAVLKYKDFIFPRARVAWKVLASGFLFSILALISTPFFVWWASERVKAHLGLSSCSPKFFAQFIRDFLRDRLKPAPPDFYGRGT